MSQKVRERYSKGYIFGFLLIKLIGTVLIILACISAADALQVTLGWEVPVTGPPDGYRVFSRLEGQNYDYTDPAWEGSATTCTLFDLQDTTTHFVVRAYNSYGESDDSNEVTYEPSNSPSPSPLSPTTQGSSGGGGGCFIVTAALHSDPGLHPLLLLGFSAGVVLALVVAWRRKR
jgi:hypothetical protein